MTLTVPSASAAPSDQPSDSRFGGPKVTGPLPGPRSAELLARQEQRESNARVYPRHFPFAVAEAAGSYIRDLDGNVFIDFLAGAGVLSFGHNHPELVAAATEQMGVFTHGLDMPSPAKDAFTSAQLAMLPAGMRDHVKIQFCGPTGANAVDAAIKLAKTATGRGDIIAFSGGFHGTTHAGMALTGNVSMKRPIANGMPGVHFFPFSSGGVPAGVDAATWDTTAVALLEQALTDPNGGIALPAAVIMEMVQGEGGVNPASKEFAQRVRRLTRELGIPLIVDEVQTGCGRTGTWFAFEQYDIEPDVIVASKALSGMGLPVAIIIYHERLDVWAPGAHTGTFRGNQLAFAAGTKAVELMHRDNILGNVRARGAQVESRLTGALADNPVVVEVRGRGLMWGIELAAPGDGRTAGELAAQVQALALRAGLILELGGRDDRVVRMLPPLNVTERTVDLALSILLDAIEGASVASE
jgi:2,4-diaminobutyrate 4-transaminase